MRAMYLSGVSISAGVPCQDEHPKDGAAFGIGRIGDTSPRLGCCKVAGGSCGGNLLRVQRLTAKQTAHGSCAGNLRPPLGELVESTSKRLNLASRRAHARIASAPPSVEALRFAPTACAAPVVRP